jgi:hypothetical protein
MNSTEQDGFTEAWERSKPFLANALERSGNEYTVDDVLKEIEEDHAIFYPVAHGATVFRIASYPQKRMLKIWLFGGEKGTGRANLTAVMDAADFQHACDGIELAGRRGWEKVLASYGYQHRYAMLIKDLGD